MTVAPLPQSTPTNSLSPDPGLSPRLQPSRDGRQTPACASILGDGAEMWSAVYKFNAGLHVFFSPHFRSRSELVSVHLGRALLSVGAQ